MPVSAFIAWKRLKNVVCQAAQHHGDSKHGGYFLVRFVLAHSEAPDRAALPTTGMFFMKGTSYKPILISMLANKSR
jgi:hypothetical protein